MEDPTYEIRKQLKFAESTIEGLRAEKRQMLLTIAQLSSRPTKENYDALMSQLETVTRQLHGQRQQMTFVGTMIIPRQVRNDVIPIIMEEPSYVRVNDAGDAFRYALKVLEHKETAVTAPAPTAPSIPLNALRFGMGAGKMPRIIE